MGTFCDYLINYFPLCNIEPLIQPVSVVAYTEIPELAKYIDRMESKLFHQLAISRCYDNSRKTMAFLQQLGVDCSYAEGFAMGDMMVNHAWNYIRSERGIIHFDLTYDVVLKMKYGAHEPFIDYAMLYTSSNAQMLYNYYRKPVATKTMDVINSHTPTCTRFGNPVI